MRSTGILLALVLAGAAMPAAFSYQEDQGQVSQNHDEMSFDDFSNRTLSFDDDNKTLSFDFSNKTLSFDDLNKTHFRFDFSNRTLSFDDFENKTHFRFDFSNKTSFSFDLKKTNYGQEVSYFEHQINYFKEQQKGTAKTIKDQLKVDRTSLQEQFKALKQDVTAKITNSPNHIKQMKSDKTNQNEKGPHRGHG